ncbi:MAG TPA: ROK family protein, partial [Egibacteraceae bacterium]|nr:ROK family protein [Egibacteraceae bacterium]
CPCGNTGCLEALASGSAIGRLATEAAAAGQLPPDSALRGQLELTGKSVTLAAQAGDEFAIGILETCGFWLGVGIATLVNALDPELVVVGGGAMQAGDLLLEPARTSFLDRLEGRGHRAAPDVVAAHLGDHAGMIGAALLALDAAADRLPRT